MATSDILPETLCRCRSIKWARSAPNVLPMSVAEVDARPVPAVVGVLFRMVAEGDTGYPKLPDYQDAFVPLASDVWGWDIDPAAVSLVRDVMMGMREMTLATTKPGDAIVINPPIYPPFRVVYNEARRRIVEIPTTRTGRLNFDALEVTFEKEHLTAHLLCSPHNPSGVVHTAEELARVMKLANTHDVVATCDEIHAPLSGVKHTPLHRMPGGGRAFVVTPSSKPWDLAGLETGLIIPGAEVANVIRGLSGYVSESASYLEVMAYVTALNEGHDWLAEAAVEAREGKQHPADELHRATSELTYAPSQGTYLAWLDCSPLGLDHAGQHFFEKAKVRFGQGTGYAPSAAQFMRANLVTSKEITSEAVHRMAASL